MQAWQKEIRRLLEEAPSTDEVAGLLPAALPETCGKRGNDILSQHWEQFFKAPADFETCQ